jgi:hypothetical protein
LWCTCFITKTEVSFFLVCALVTKNFFYSSFFNFFSSLHTRHFIAW